MKEKKLLWIILFNCVIIISEIVFGIISNSFALIADALHNAGDVVALVITFIALKLGSRKSSFRYTFGFLKSEMMAAFVNTLFLSITMFYLIYEAVNRFFHPEIIEPLYMIVVGIIAVIANGVSAYLLTGMNVAHTHSHEHSHNRAHQEDANIKSAYLHMLSDALISVGVVVAGIFIYYFEIYYIDSVLTIIFSLYILKHSFPLLKKSFLSLMDVNITTVSESKLDEIIKEDIRVVEYHDLHIYKPDSKHDFISFHIVLDDDTITLKETENICNDIREKLLGHEFNHILIQVDSNKYIKHEKHCTMS